MSISSHKKTGWERQDRERRRSKIDRVREFCMIRLCVRRFIFPFEKGCVSSVEISEGRLYKRITYERVAYERVACDKVVVARLLPDAMGAAAVCVGGVALGDIDLHFAWQAG